MRVPSPPEAGLAKVVLLLGVAGAVVVGGGTAAVLTSGGQSVTSAVGVNSSPSPKPAPATVAVVGASGRTVSWAKPLSLAITGGTLQTVTATGPDGGQLAGSLSPTRWTSVATLIPTSHYALHATYTDSDGSTRSVDRTLVASKPTHVLHAFFYPHGAVGVGQPLVVKFDRRVKGVAARTAVLERLKVTTSPAVQGAWRFYDSYEAHFRPAAYWRPGTTITARADLAGLKLPGTGTWGQTAPETSTMRIGDALVSTVDITAHTMTVTRNGATLKTVKVSTGRVKYPTKGGVHIVLTVEREHLYNSDTVGIPRNGPDGYYEKLPYSMRISNGGAFVHANPATEKYQGHLNVSHGCVNLSLADAKWFYEISHRGDVVNIIHAVVKPVLSDAGMSDWNYSWATWQKGNLDG